MCSACLGRKDKKEKEMPKMKTRSGAKKRFKVTASGKVKVKQAFARHMQMNKPKSMKRKARGTTVLCDSDERIVLRNFLPYARKKKNKAAKKAEGGE
jgi:large subunit ribosomal protein L35